MLQRESTTDALGHVGCGAATRTFSIAQNVHCVPAFRLLEESFDVDATRECARDESTQPHSARANTLKAPIPLSAVPCKHAVSLLYNTLEAQASRVIGLLSAGMVRIHTFKSTFDVTSATKRCSLRRQIVSCRLHFPILNHFGTGFPEDMTLLLCDVLNAPPILVGPWERPAEGGACSAAFRGSGKESASRASTSLRKNCL